MKRQRRRKCRHCGTLYRPDHRNHRHQKYCTKSGCRRASKDAAQAKWLASPKGHRHFHGPEHVQRVQTWRKANPDYWRHRRRKAVDALQDDCGAQDASDGDVTHSLMRDALQDVCSSQPAILVGLISSLTGSALQDDIAGSLRRFHARGQEILGIGLGTATKGADHDGL